ncbi:MAG: hypothetical protein AB7S54_02670 [Bacteroidales bacterium]
MKRLLLPAILLQASIGIMAQNPEAMLKALERPDTVRNGSSLTTKSFNSSSDSTVESGTITKAVAVETAVPDSLSNRIEHNAVVNNVDNDTTIIRIGRKKIMLIDKDDKTTIEFPEKSEKTVFYEFKSRRKFKGHWAGFEMGVNGFMDKNQSANLKGNVAWLDLKQARSWNVNINFMQYSIGLGSNWAGLVTGMGLEFNDYHFSNPIGLKVNNGITIADSSYIISGYKVNKSKLSTVNLTLPLIVEFQIPTGERGHKIYVSTGVMGGLRLGSHTKVVYDDGEKHKSKTRDDFNIATFRYGITARLGYRAIRLYANYYPTQLFEKDKGPEIYPFAVGLVLIPF